MYNEKLKSTDLYMNTNSIADVVEIRDIFSFLRKRNKDGFKELDFFISSFILGYKGRWLGGGAIRRFISEGKNEADWDVFFDSKESYESFIERCRDFGIFDIKESDANTSFKLKKIFLSDPDDRGNTQEEIYEYNIQAVRMNYYSCPQEAISMFDYTICQFLTDGEKLWMGEGSLYDLGRKRLVVNNITYPVASLRRLIKYINQGFYACSGCLESFLNSVVENPNLLSNNSKYID